MNKKENSKQKQRTIKDVLLKGTIPQEKIKKAVDEVMALEKDEKKLQQLLKQLRVPKIVSNTLIAIKKIPSEKFDHYRDQTFQKLGYFAALKTKIKKMKTITDTSSVVLSVFAEESSILIDILNRESGSPKQLTDSLKKYLDSLSKDAPKDTQIQRLLIVQLLIAACFTVRR